MKFAVCDDLEADRKKIAALLDAYGDRRRVRLSVRCFSGGPELVQAVQAGAAFDVILLDILMPGGSGLETARELREFDKRAEIIFLTVSPDYALEAYSVRARHYILKPVGREPLFRLLDEIADQLTKDQGVVLAVNTKSGLRRLRADHLEYCEIIGRTLCYHMASGAVFQASGNMGDLERRLLSLPNFCKPHRSYIVNMDYISQVDSRACVLRLESMKQIPVPRIRCGQVRETVLTYLEQKGGREV